MNQSTLDILQGELERLYDLPAMMRLCSGLLGFDPERVGGTGSKGAFARSLVGYCSAEHALPALVDAIVLTSRDEAAANLRGALKNLSNGELSPGTKVGSLRVVKKLGEGGLSVVYLAHDESGAETALKVIRHEYARDRAAVHRFTTVSRIMQSLKAPGLAPIVGVGQLDDARPWVAAQLVHGQSLADRIKRAGPLHVNEARTVFEGVLRGLSALHSRGLLHGDVKVENVFVVRADDDKRSGGELGGVLVDAGADRLLSQVDAKPDATGILPMIGTAKAIAPEQARGAGGDPRSDLYAMGTLMYETLTGRPPFVGDSAIDVIAQHLSQTPEPPSVYARKGWVSDALDELVLRALAKDPGDRPQSAEDMIEALDQAVRRPGKRRPLDEIAFTNARTRLLANPGDEAAADAVENQARDSGAWDRAATVFAEAARAARVDEEKLTLLFRAARIYETDLKDALRAESCYQQVLEVDPDSEVALRGVEAARRATNDHQGLVEVLLERIERESSDETRGALLHEVAGLYEEKLLDPNNAVVAWVQALVHDPQDPRALRAVERLASGSDLRMAEAIETLTAAAQASHAALFGDEQAAREQAAAELAGAEHALAEARAQVEQLAEARAAEEKGARAARGESLAAAEQGAAQAYAVLEAAQAEHASLQLRVRELEQAAHDKRMEHEQTHAAAEAAVEAYEQAEATLGEAPNEEQQAQFAELAAEAERLVEAASAIEAEIEALSQELSAAQGQLGDSQTALEEAEQRAEAADGAAQELRGDDLELIEDDDASALALTDEEAAYLAQAEQRVSQAQAAVAHFDALDQSDRAAQRRKDLANLVQMYVIMGRWYATRLGRPDFALSCFSQALSLDVEHEAAFEGLTELYRTSQAWAELASTLLARADRAGNPVKARTARAQAAIILSQKLGDEAQARAHLERVLTEDPAHAQAQEALGQILAVRQDYPAMAQLLERRLQALEGEAKIQTHLELAELYEDRLEQIDRAESHYRSVVEAAHRKLDAWKGLERIHARNENYEGLLAALRAQVDLASTPRQRIGLYERIGLLLEEEFVNHVEAAAAFEEIVAIDPNNDAANTALARLYRQLSRFEDVVATLHRHATSVSDDKRKVALMLQAVRVLTVDIGSPERAMEMCERILDVDSEEPEALSELARLKSTAGDVSSALAAVERLAENEQDLHKRAEHWVRAGKLLEEGGDRDGAISRYKKALDADRNTVAAADALRSIYARRGDAHGAIEMLLHAIEMSEGEHKRAQLFGELGALYHERIEDEARAEEAFNTALELDATCTTAQVGLGQIAFARGEHERAAELLGSVLGRLDELPKDKAAEVCLRAGESFAKVEQPEKALDAFKRARDFMPDDLAVNERYAAMVMESGDAKGAERLYERIWSKFESELDVSEKCRVLRSWADAQLAGKHVKQSLETWKRVLELKADDPEALAGLTRSYEEARNFSEVINLLQLRARRATDTEQRFDLLVRTGDVFLEKIRDRDAAAQTYVMALDLQPDNRNLLTKLMGVYSDAQDWSRLIEVILRIADMVQAPDQLAKYYNTAATIAHQELGRFDEAANYYEEALAHMPPTQGQAQLKGLVECLTQNQDWERLDRAYEARIERMRQSGAPGPEVAAMLDARAEALSQRLNRTAEALSLYEEAQALDPQNRARRDMLTAVYTKEPKRYFSRAVAAHRAQLADDPYRVESLQALRRIYTSGKRPDESWCLCQALRCMQMADVDEEKFFKKYRLTSLPKARRPVDEDLYRRLIWHPAQDPGLTAIFATLTPAIVSAQSQPLSSFGIDARNYTDPAGDPTAMGRMLAHVADMTSTRLPEVYHAPNDVGGLSFLFTAPPAIGIGQGARAGGPQQALAFVAGRHLSYYRPGHYIRQLVPTGTGLRTWLFAAIRTVSPKFPIPATMESSVKECIEQIRTHLTGPQRDALRSMTQKLLEAAPELDMKGWMAAVDLSADRVGFVLSNDLKVSQAVIEASPEDVAVISRKDRQRELLVYSTSEPYFELRKALGISLGS